MTAASLYALPIELIFKILDNLDIQTILFSFQNVCKRFYSIGNTYNQYELDMSSISKNDFHRISRIVRPENIIALTLSDHDMTPGQIPLFMSLFHMNQFIHLRSLTLIQIEKTQLIQLISDMNINALDTLAINTRKNNSKSEDVSIIPLLSKIAMANLRRLDLSMWNHEINNFVWPQQCTLQHLSIGHYVTYTQMCIILSQLNQLRTLVVRNGIVTTACETMIRFSDIEKNTNLISLTFKNSRLQMNELELLLSLVPFLVHLQLTGNVDSSDAILDGSRWEELIQVKLPLLEKFEFFFRAKTENNRNSSDIESWIAPFRTIFWVKQKSWFVTCNYVLKTATLRLCTVPICDPTITYESDFDKIAYTTCTSIENDVLNMNNVHEVQLNLTQLITTITAQKITPRNNNLFRKLTELTLTINGEWPLDSIHYLSTLIDLSQLTSLGLYVNLDHSSASNTMNNIDRLLQQACQVRSLTVANSFCDGSLNGIVETLCSIVPRHVKHLDVYNMDLNDIKILLTRLKHLSSVTFVFLFDMPFSPTEIIEWLSQRIDFTYLVDNSSLSIWLGNDITMQAECVLTATALS